MHKLIRTLPRFRVAERVLRDMQRRECWSREQINHWQLERLNRLWNSARRFVPFYRNLASQLPLPDRFDCLGEFIARVPVLQKSVVRENTNLFLSTQAQPGKWSRTSGSTGVPTSVFWESAAHQEMLRCKYRGEQAWGLDIFDRKALLWGKNNATSTGWRGSCERFLEPLVDRLRCRSRLSAYRLSEDDLENHIRMLQRNRSVSLYGYSTAVSLLARHAEATKAKLPFLRLAIMTGEPADRKMISQCKVGFGCGVAVEYGSVECGLLAYRFPDEIMRVREDVVFLETCKRADGLYDIVVTVLNNPSFPLLRYKIGDTTESEMIKPAEGFASLSNVTGRANDMLVSKTGCIVHSMAIKHALENHPLVRRFRAIQQADGRLEVEIETHATDPESFSGCQHTLVKWMDGFPVRLSLTRQLRASDSGKHRWIFSMYRGDSIQSDAANIQMSHAE